MASGKKFERIVGVDISRHSLFLEVIEGFTMDYVSIESLPRGDDEIDVVTCMETIEHIPDAIFEKGWPSCAGSLFFAKPRKRAEPAPAGP